MVSMSVRVYGNTAIAGICMLLGIDDKKGYGIKGYRGLLTVKSREPTHTGRSLILPCQIWQGHSGVCTGLLLYTKCLGPPGV